MSTVAITAPFPGTRRVLEEGYKMGMWECVVLDGGSIHIPQADVYILGAWTPSYERLLHLPGKIGLVWTSSVGEMDFTPIEQGYLQAILRDPRISFVWFGDESLAQAYPQKGFYAPYPLCMKGAEPPTAEKRDIATLFCPTKPSKNILSQLVAMKLVQRQMGLTLYTNAQGYDTVLAEIDHVRRGWLPDPEYRALLASARVNLCCSWAETYSYQCAEAGLAGTRSVISPTIPLPGKRVGNPNDPSEIAEAIISCVNRSSAPGQGPYWEMIEAARKLNTLLLTNIQSLL